MKRKTLAIIGAMFTILIATLIFVGSHVFFYSGDTGGNGKSSKNGKQTISIIGHWRNDTEKVDYVFSERSGYLSIVKENGGSECTYEVTKKDDEKSHMEIWFKCPMPDWPGYAEFHELTFLDSDKFVDTKSIQGIPYRVDGEFIRIGFSN